MTTIRTKECDVTFVRRGVEAYRVTVTQESRDGVAIPSETVLNATVDLCGKAYDRLGGFILRGCTPPPPRTKKGDDTADTDPEEDATEDMPPVEHPAEAPSS